MQEKLIVTPCPPTAGTDNLASDFKIELQVGDSDPVPLKRVRSLTIDASDRAATVKLEMYIHDLEAVVLIDERQAMLIREVESGRRMWAIGDLDEDDERAIRDLYAQWNRTTPAEHRALAKLVNELDARAASKRAFGS